jgi:dTMP kinase
MKKARYICIEGTEGVGKTTQTQLLVDFLRSKGYSVLQTKEPGTSHLPITMTLRALMLDNQYNEFLTRQARELISQAIRSIHLDKLITPALETYDYIVQDRGILSGFSYGTSCGNNTDDIINLSNYVCGDNINMNNLYDDIIYLKGNVGAGLTRALSSKKEFKAGDAMESRGTTFLEDTSSNMDKFSNFFKNCHKVQVDDKNIDAVFNEILTSLRINA